MSQAGEIGILVQGNRIAATPRWDAALDALRSEFDLQRRSAAGEVGARTVLLVFGDTGFVKQTLVDLESLRAEGSICVLAVVSAPSELSRALCAGVDDAFLLSGPCDELRARVRRFVRRVHHSADAVALDLRSADGEVLLDNERFVLPPAPLKILRCLAERQGAWCSQPDIMATCFPYLLRSDHSVVRVHIQRLRQALRHQGQRIESSNGRGRGYRLNLDRVVRVCDESRASTSSGDGHSAQ